MLKDSFSWVAREGEAVSAKLRSEIACNFAKLMNDMCVCDCFHVSSLFQLVSHAICFRDVMDFVHDMKSPQTRLHLSIVSHVDGMLFSASKQFPIACPWLLHQGNTCCVSVSGEER